MSATRAIFLVVSAGSLMPAARLPKRYRMISRHVGVMVMVCMARMAMGSMIRLRIAAATNSASKRKKLLRSATAQSGSARHRQAKIRSEYNTNHDPTQTPVDCQASVLAFPKARKTSFVASRRLFQNGGSKQMLWMAITHSYRQRRCTLPSENLGDVSESIDNHGPKVRCAFNAIQAFPRRA